MTVVCCYCGRRTDRRVACHAHAELPAIDPFFSPDVPQKVSKPVERTLDRALLDGLNRKRG